MATRGERHHLHRFDEYLRCDRCLETLEAFVESGDDCQWVEFCANGHPIPKRRSAKYQCPACSGGSRGNAE